MIKTAKNHTLRGRTYLCSPYNEVLPSPGLITPAAAMELDAVDGCTKLTGWNYRSYKKKIQQKKGYQKLGTNVAEFSANCFYKQNRLT